VEHDALEYSDTCEKERRKVQTKKQKKEKENENSFLLKKSHKLGGS